MESYKPGPLSHLNVLDLTHLVAGPYCTMLLSDAGAHVTKIEPPGGELSHRRGAIRTYPSGQTASSYILAFNRGKDCIAIDLKTDSGRSIFFSLLRSADVVVENFRQGALERLGLGWDVLRRHKSDIILCSINYAAALEKDDGIKRGALAIIAEAESGLASLCTDDTGRPISYDAPLADFITGLMAYSTIVTRLASREATGRGEPEHIEISMLSGMLSLNSCAIAAFGISGKEKLGAAVPYGYFRCADGYFAIGVNSDRAWADLCDAMNQPCLGDDSRFQTYQGRVDHKEDITRIVERWARERRRDEIVTRLNGFGVPVGAMNTVGEAAGSVEYAQAGLLIQVGDGYGGHVSLPANPMGFKPVNPVVQPTRRWADDEIA